MVPFGLARELEPEASDSGTVRAAASHRAGEAMTPLTGLDDVGRQLIETIHDVLQIDEEWTSWQDDGFIWWSHRLAQRFRVDGPEEVDGVRTWWASFETSVLRNVPEGSPAVTAAIALQNRMNNLFTTKVVDGRLSHWGRAYALPETATSRAKLVAERAIISNALASEQAEVLSELLGRLTQTAVEVDASAHPENGARTEPDEMLGVVRRVYSPAGSMPVGAHKMPDLNALAAMLDGPGQTTFTDERGLNLGITGSSHGFAYGVHIDLTARHPVLGAGMLVLLSILLGDAAEVAEANDVATKLNDGELVTRRPLISFGSWSVAGKPSAAGEGGYPIRLAHATFYPAATLNHQVALMAAADAMQRVAWLSDAVGRVDSAS